VLCVRRRPVRSGCGRACVPVTCPRPSRCRCRRTGAPLGRAASDVHARRRRHLHQGRRRRRRPGRQGEQSIPEDDSRNTTTIADNVGDCARRRRPDRPAIPDHKHRIDQPLSSVPRRRDRPGQPGSRGEGISAGADWRGWCQRGHRRPPADRLGTGGPERADDLGTDLFVQVRDARRFDRGLVVGVQVKGGPEWFKDPVRAEDGSLLGWWYYEPKVDHFDDWVTPSTPPSPGWKGVPCPTSERSASHGCAGS
jgi:Domain of unknown function (DUF4365)